METKTVDNNNYEGIGGWLFLVILKYFISILSCWYAIIPFASLNFESILNSIFLIFNVIVLILLFKEMRCFIQYASILLILEIVFNSIVLYWINSIGCFEIKDLVPIIIGRTVAGSILPIILITYFIESKRVKNTFVN